MYPVLTHCNKVKIAIAKGIQAPVSSVREIRLILVFLRYVGMSKGFFSSPLKYIEIGIFYMLCGLAINNLSSFSIRFTSIAALHSGANEYLVTCCTPRGAVLYVPLGVKMVRKRTGPRAREIMM